MACIGRKKSLQVMPILIVDKYINKLTGHGMAKTFYFKYQQTPLQLC
ncbi:hypothetical protein BSG1_21295 [Bacillus sp. SG-1]|nr:hypothetical protein BSG1_21295 [Bacillus sp. SG-1]